MSNDWKSIYENDIMDDVRDYVFDKLPISVQEKIRVRQMVFQNYEVSILDTIRDTGHETLVKILLQRIGKRERKRMIIIKKLEDYINKHNKQDEYSLYNLYAFNINAGHEIKITYKDEKFLILHGNKEEEFKMSEDIEEKVISYKNGMVKVTKEAYNKMGDENLANEIAKELLDLVGKAFTSNKYYVNNLGIEKFSDEKVFKDYYVLVEELKNIGYSHYKDYRKVVSDLYTKTKHDEDNLSD